MTAPAPGSIDDPPATTGTRPPEEVPLFKEAVFPGKYVQGVGALGELPALVELLGKKGLILVSPSANDKVLPASGVDWSDRGVAIEVFRGECCEEELGRLSAAIARAGADVLVGIGGGKAIDTAKIAADRARIPVIVVPTIASTDAPTSGCAVIYSKDGVFDSESAGLAAAHAIHNGLTALAETHSSYHGEKVAFGTLAGLHLTDAPTAETETVYSFCEDVGLPTTLAAIGLGKADRRQLTEVAEKACAPGQPIHHEAGAITPARVLDAMLVADALGQERKSRGGGHRDGVSTTRPR